MLCLKRGNVTSAEPHGGATGFQRLRVTIDGDERAAVTDVALTGRCEAGDDVVVNVEAVELGLGSGGNDIVLVNLTRGLGAMPDAARHVQKLNYTPLQHGVDPVERPELRTPLRRPVAVFQLHAHLPCIAWAAERERPGVRLGYVQTAGGALSGGMSATVAELLDRGLLCDHLTAAPSYGGRAEAISTIGAIHAGIVDRGWDGAIVGPGPGILGSGSALGHGGMVALDSLHAALALGCEAIAVVRASSGDARERHSGISHHTRTVLELLLDEVTVALGPNAPRVAELARHRILDVEPDLEAYHGSGLPSSTMGRSMHEDPLFFEQALAGGIALASAIAGRR